MNWFRQAFQKLLSRLASLGGLRTVLTSAARVFAIRMTGAAITYASMIFLARWLGAFEFGIYAYVTVLVTLLGLGLSCGFNSSSLRFVSDYLARGKWGRLTGFFIESYGVVVVVSMTGSLLAAGAVVALRGFIEPYFYAPFLAGLLCVPVTALLNQGEAMARAFGRVNLAYVPGYIVRPSLLVVFVGGLVLLGRSPSAVTAVWAVIAACVVAVVGQGVLVWLEIRKRVPRVAPRFHGRHWVAVSLSFLMIDGFRMLLDNSDVLLIGRLLDPHNVALYFAAIRTGGLVAFVSFSMIALAVPKFAEIHVTGTRQELQTFVSGVIHLTFWPSLITAVVLAAAGPFVLSLFGKGFEAAYPAMLVILTGLVLRSASGPVEYLLNMTGHHRDTVRVYAVAGAATIALNLLLIPLLGIIGAAIATYTAMLGANVWLYFLVRRRLGVSAFIIPVGGGIKRRAPATPLTAH